MFACFLLSFLVLFAVLYILLSQQFSSSLVPSRSYIQYQVTIEFATTLVFCSLSLFCYQYMLFDNVYSVVLLSTNFTLKTIIKKRVE